MPVDLILSETLFTMRKLQATDPGASGAFPSYTAKQDLEKLYTFEFENSCTKKIVRILMNYYS